jgi:PAS domain S-box-containing protein
LTEDPKNVDPGHLELALSQSEEITRGILAAVPAGVVYVRSDGAIQTANAEALRLLGLSYDALTRRYTQDFEPETIHEDGTICRAEDYPVTQAIQSGEISGPVTIGVRRPGADLSWCVFRAVPVKDRDGKTTGAVVTFHDITDRIRDGQMLRRSQAKLEALLSSAPNLIFTADLEGTFTFMNRTMPELTCPVEAPDVVGQSMFAWVNDRDHAMLREKIRRVAEHGVIVRYEVAGLDGVDPNEYETTLGPIRDDHGVVGIVGIVSLIVERKRAERERVRLLAQLAESQRLEALGRLAGGVAHDFNNLLTVIEGNVDLILGEIRAESLAAELAQEIRAASSRAAALTKQLLAFGRRQPLEPKLLDLRASVSAIAPMLRRTLGEHVELVLELAWECGVVRADPAEIDRVLVNLVRNAHDAMPSGGVATIAVQPIILAEGEVENAAAGPYVELCVSDTGEGMDTETLRRAFEPFFTTKSADRGTGLGLATVHGIVNQSGGVVTMAAIPDRGTRARVLLPMLDARPEGSPVAQLAPPKCPAAILLVEDEVSVRRVAKMILEGEGHRIIEFSSAEEALALDDAELAKIDLIVTDVVMPKMSGPAMAERLLIRGPQLKVLLMSGHVPEKFDGLVGGFKVLAKPFDRKTLSAKVRAILEPASP